MHDYMHIFNFAALSTAQFLFSFLFFSFLFAKNKRNWHRRRNKLYNSKIARLKNFNLQTELDFLKISPILFSYCFINYTVEEIN